MFLIGADPEVFVVNKSTKKIVPAIGLIEGTKEFPRKVQQGALQEDNVMAEFNITPANSFPLFQSNIATVLKEMDSVLGASGHEYDKSFRTSHEFSTRELDHPQAMQFGCNPDDNIYTLRQNEGITPALVGNIRMCGGHIHLGFKAPDRHPLLRILAVRWMDIYVGAPLAALDPDKTRRHYYGLAGNYRQKPYGVEYRTVSNFWLSHPLLIKFVWDQTILAMTMAEQLRRLEASADITPQTIRNIINSSNVSDIVSMIGRFGIKIPKIPKETVK